MSLVGAPATSFLVEQAQSALMLSLAVALPVLAVAAVVGLLVAAFQAASQIQDPTIAHLPRLLAVIVALVILGPWMGSQIGAFAERMMQTTTR
ncbi:MAG: flagellar biosynthetic protein FliQ [Deltaproteobacteria bacterium]|nr:flagellar biosynthetic protein FliQ [Deltaproteobacteria bacterium]